MNSLESGIEEAKTLATSQFEIPFHIEDLGIFDDGTLWVILSNCGFGLTVEKLAQSLHGASEDDADLYVMINASQEAVAMRIQEGAAANWLRVIDTSRPSPDDFRGPGDELRLSSSEHSVSARSVVVFLKLRRVE